MYVDWGDARAGRKGIKIGRRIAVGHLSADKGVILLVSADPGLLPLLEMLGAGSGDRRLLFPGMVFEEECVYGLDACPRVSS